MTGTRSYGSRLRRRRRSPCSSIVRSTRRISICANAAPRQRRSRRRTAPRVRDGRSSPRKRSGRKGRGRGRRPRGGGGDGWRRTPRSPGGSTGRPSSGTACRGGGLRADGRSDAQRLLDHGVEVVVAPGATPRGVASTSGCGRAVEGPGQRGRRRLVAGEQERDELVAELVVVDRRAVLVAGLEDIERTSSRRRGRARGAQHFIASTSLHSSDGAVDGLLGTSVASANSTATGERGFVAASRTSSTDRSRPPARPRGAEHRARGHVGGDRLMPRWSANGSRSATARRRASDRVISSRVARPLAVDGGRSGPRRRRCSSPPERHRRRPRTGEGGPRRPEGGLFTLPRAPTPP